MLPRLAAAVVRRRRPLPQGDWQIFRVVNCGGGSEGPVHDRGRERLQSGEVVVREKVEHVPRLPESNVDVGAGVVVLARFIAPLPPPPPLAGKLSRNDLARGIMEKYLSRGYTYTAFTAATS